jgi:hypothetical protein
MKDTPMLFSGAMVRAILEGRKSQTRRVVKPQPIASPTNPPHDAKVGALYVCPDRFPTSDKQGSVIVHCEGPGITRSMGQLQFTESFSPYGTPGDRLWVRETWRRERAGAGTEGLRYRADDDTAGVRWTPAIHMPRTACRIELEVTEVRVERLQAITWQDAEEEGVGHVMPKSAVEMYQELWDSLNAARGYGWAVNPWVWVVSFKRVAALRIAA